MSHLYIFSDIKGKGQPQQVTFGILVIDAY